MPGSRFKLPFPDCLVCKCTTKAMSCCGFGYASGNIIPPTGCVAHNDGCKVVFVKQSDSSELCKTIKRTTKPKKKLRASRR